MQTITRDEARQRARSISLTSIDVDLDLSDAADLQRTTFPSTSTLRFTTSSTTTFIDIVAASIRRVSVDGEDATYRVEDARIVLDDLPTGREITVVVDAECTYSTSGEGLHRYRDPEDGNVYLYTQYEPCDARRVYACFDQPDLKARWTMRVEAPAEWVVLSNQHEINASSSRDGVTRHEFAPTQPLSSYITAVIAGPYAHFDGGIYRGGVEGEEPVEIALGVYCRQALAPYCDADDIINVTRHGFDFYHRHYGITYPWGHVYNQIFVPEYNLGAMENPGCVTFTENDLSRDTPTPQQKQSRANTIMHEMCHMWFGDLVTPRWWGDLWLKESFADNQGSWAIVASGDYPGEWASFAAGRKAWAYRQDQLPTTHPIVADVPDVEAATHNFDGITYAKGAAVLKQLVAYVGEEAFFAGVRRYFTTHQWGSTELADFLAALEAVSGTDDLDEWQKLWLHTTGPSTITIHTIQGEDGGTAWELRQVGHDLVTGEDIVRPHALNLGFYARRDGSVERVASTRVTLRERALTVTLPPEADEATIDFVLPNDDDLTYAVIAFDDDATDFALDHVGHLPGAVSRAVVWGALWQAVRDARLDPVRYVDAVIAHIDNETEDALVSVVLAQALAAIRSYLPSQLRDRVATDFAASAMTAAANAGSEDRRRTWVETALSAMISIHSLSEAKRTFAEAIAQRRSSLLDVGPSLAWQARRVLVRHEVADDARIGAWEAEDPSGEAVIEALRCRAMLPDRGTRRTLWDRCVDDDVSNDQLSAILIGLRQGTKPGVTGLAGEFYQAIDHYWQSHSVGMSRRFIREAFPDAVDADHPEDAQALLFMADTWLRTHEDAPPSLIRLMREHDDELRRAWAIQQRGEHGWSSR